MPLHCHPKIKSSSSSWWAYILSESEKNNPIQRTFTKNMQDFPAVKHHCRLKYIFKWMASLIAQLVKNPPVWFLGREDPLEKGQATHFSILGLPLWLSWKRIHLKSGDLSLIPGLGRSSEKGNDYPFHYSVLDKSIDCMVHRVPKSQIWLRDFHFHTLAKC